MSGTTHPVTHYTPEVQHPQYLISLYISNTALSVTMKGLWNNHKNLRRAKTGSWNFQNKRQKCQSLDFEMWVLLMKTEIFVCFCQHFSTLYYKYNSYTLGIYFFKQCCSNSEHWQSSNKAIFRVGIISLPLNCPQTNKPHHEGIQKCL
jgi:hypothetical protein